MADTKLNANHGYGQVELNNCAFRRDGRIEAQCKIGQDSGTDIEYVENGMILAIDNTTRTVGYPTSTSYMFGLNYTTEHMYDERLVGGLRYFKLDRDSFLPRLGYVAVGDKFTTNTIIYDDGLTLAAGQMAYVMPADKGYIRVAATVPASGSVGPQFKVLAVTTMPDGAPGLKLQCVKA